MTVAVAWALGAVVVTTVALGLVSGRWSRTTDDFLVASRSVRPGRNAAAISGEYLSAASMLGIGAVLVRSGPDALWYPIGFTLGHLALLLFVVAPLRRSGAFTLPDFAQLRFRSPRLRRWCTLVALLVVGTYLVPQLYGAGLLLAGLLEFPRWVGVVGAAVVVTATVAAGGMRSITLVQAVQYWFKLVAVLVPVLVLVVVLRGDGFTALDSAWARPGGFGTLEIYSILVATTLGAMGLPHVLGHFYANAGGAAARRTAVGVIGLLGLFYLALTGLGVLARSVGVPDDGDLTVLAAPGVALGDGWGSLLGALLASGAVAAFLSTSAGLLVAAAGVLSTDVLRGRVRDFRWAALLGMVGPVLVALVTVDLEVTRVVGLAFALAAATFGPLLVLGIWWRGLTAVGAAAGLACGVLTTVGSVGVGLVVDGLPEPWAGLLLQPGLVTVPLTFLVMVVVSLRTASRVPSGVDAVLARMHLPGRRG